MDRKQKICGFTPARLLGVFAAALCCSWYFSTARGTASPAPENTVSLLFCGDVMLDWGIKEVYRAHGPKYSLENIGGFMSAFDFRFCNLECPVSSEGTPSRDKKYIFITEPAALDILRWGFIDGVTLANNHAMDFGEIALLNTMTHLKEKGIVFTGAGLDADAAHLPLLVKIKGLSLAVFGYTNLGYPESYATASSPGIARASLELIRRDIQKFRGFNDAVIVSLHWGDEYSHFPSPEQEKMGRAIIDMGADAIIGHHSHIYQGIEIYRDKPIVYSLGNFLFGSTNEDILDNIVVALRFRDKRLSALEVYPVKGNNDPQHRFQPKQMTGNEGDALLHHVIDISRPLKSDFHRKARLKNTVIHFNFPVKAKESPADE